MVFSQRPACSPSSAMKALNAWPDSAEPAGGHLGPGPRAWRTPRGAAQPRLMFDDIIGGFGRRRGQGIALTPDSSAPFPAGYHIIGRRSPRFARRRRHRQPQPSAIAHRRIVALVAARRDAAETATVLHE
jgi:hypothetical protein